MDTSKKPSTKGGRRRAVHFVLREDECPGLIEFLDSLENRMESKTVRAILFKWFEERREEGTVDLIDAAVKTVHVHDLAVLQRKVDPDLSSTMSIGAAYKGKQAPATVALVDSRPPSHPGTVGDAGAAFSGMTNDSTEPRHVVPEVMQKVPEEKAPAAESEPVVGFLDTMFGLNDG